MAVSPARISIATMPWPGAGTQASSGIAAEIRPPKPSRRMPAAARTSASYSPPSSLRSRVSTLPRIGAKRACGIAPASWATRRTLLVPTIGASSRWVRRRRQVRMPDSAGQHERIARILARQDRRHRQIRLELGGHVLGAVHREVHVLAQERVLDFLDEQALGAGLGERPLLEAVAGRPDDDDLDARAARLEQARDRARLPQGQRRCPGCRVSATVTMAPLSSWPVSSAARLNSRFSASE